MKELPGLCLFVPMWRVSIRADQACARRRSPIGSETEEPIEKAKRRWSAQTSVFGQLLCPGGRACPGEGTPRGMSESSAPS